MAPQRATVITFDPTVVSTVVRRKQAHHSRDDRRSLTDAAIRAIKPETTPRKHADGRGLYLLVTPAGGRRWCFDYRYQGRRKRMSFGLYPDVSLASARERLQTARRQLADGRDPMADRAGVRAAERAPESFEVVSREWLAKRREAVTAGTHARISWLLERYAYPYIGRLPVAAVAAPDILRVTTRLESRGRYETMHRVKQLCGQVLRYAVATGREARDATADLSRALPPVVKTHFAAVTSPDEAGRLLRAIDDLVATPAIVAAMKLAPLVFVRPGELRTAEWAEMDLPARLWRIPAAKVKTREDHLVPLSRQAVAILEALKPVTGRGRWARWAFPSIRTSSRPLSDNTLNACLRRLGYGPSEMTAHGFRAMARTLLDEVLRFPPDVIEVQLAHRVRGPLGATYNRAKYLEERTRMMQVWADYLDTLRNADRASV